MENIVNFIFIFDESNKVINNANKKYIYIM